MVRFHRRFVAEKCLLLRVFSAGRGDLMVLGVTREAAMGPRVGAGTTIARTIARGVLARLEP